MGSPKGVYGENLAQNIVYNIINVEKVIFLDALNLITVKGSYDSMMNNNY